MLKVKADMRLRNGEWITKEFVVDYWHYATASLWFDHLDIKGRSVDPFCISMYFAHVPDNFDLAKTKPFREKIYEYKHLLCQSAFDHRVNAITFEPDLSTWGADGWRVLKILPTAKDGMYDVFLERELIQGC